MKRKTEERKPRAAEKKPRFNYWFYKGDDEKALF